MRVYKRKEFLELPAGTLYSIFRGATFKGLEIKESEPGKYSNDFDTSNLIGIHGSSTEEFFWICDMMSKGVPRAYDPYDSCGRDGFFDEDDMYAVYDKDDIRALIERLQEIIND